MKMHLLCMFVIAVTCGIATINAQGDGARIDAQEQDSYHRGGEDGHKVGDGYNTGGGDHHGWNYQPPPPPDSQPPPTNIDGNVDLSEDGTCWEGRSCSDCPITAREKTLNRRGNLRRRTVCPPQCNPDWVVLCSQNRWGETICTCQVGTNVPAPAPAPAPVPAPVATPPPTPTETRVNCWTGAQCSCQDVSRVIAPADPSLFNVCCPNCAQFTGAGFEMEGADATTCFITCLV